VRVLDAIVASDLSLRAQHPTDLLHDTFNLLQHLAVPKSDNSKAESFELLTSQIVVTLFLVGVLSSIELDNQPRFDTAEIHDERIDWHLSAEFPTVEVSVS
jgi:hypothetical protein